MTSRLNDAESDFAVTLHLPPSCVQLCPAHPDYFVVGTYSLEQSDTVQGEGQTSQSRNGSLVVFKLDGKNM